MTATHTPTTTPTSRHSRRRGLSIIVPAPNDYATAEEIYNSVRKQTEQLHVEWELLFVHDDKCGEALLIQRLVREDSHVRALTVPNINNRSAALSVGYREAHGELVFTLESDLHDDASELSRFLGRIEWDDQHAPEQTEQNESTGWWQNVLPRGVLRAA